jgi:hypothetical protein
VAAGGGPGTGPEALELWKPLSGTGELPEGASLVWTAAPDLAAALEAVLSRIPDGETVLCSSASPAAVLACADALRRSGRSFLYPHLEAPKALLPKSLLSLRLREKEEKERALASLSAEERAVKRAEDVLQEELAVHRTLNTLEANLESLRSEISQRKQSWFASDYVRAEALVAWEEARNALSRSRGGLLSFLSGGKASRDLERAERECSARLGLAEKAAGTARREREEFVREAKALKDELTGARERAAGLRSMEDSESALAAARRESAELRRRTSELAREAASAATRPPGQGDLRGARIILAREGRFPAGLPSPFPPFDNVVSLAPRVAGHRDREALAARSLMARRRFMILADFTACAWHEEPPCSEDGTPAWSRFMASAPLPAGRGPAPAAPGGPRADAAGPDAPFPWTEEGAGQAEDAGRGLNARRGKSAGESAAVGAVRPGAGGGTPAGPGAEPPQPLQAAGIPPETSPADFGDPADFAKPTGISKPADPADIAKPADAADPGNAAGRAGTPSPEDVPDHAGGADHGDAARAVRDAGPGAASPAFREGAGTAAPPDAPSSPVPAEASAPAAPDGKAPEAPADAPPSPARLPLSRAEAAALEFLGHGPGPLPAAQAVAAALAAFRSARSGIPPRPEPPPNPLGPYPAFERPDGGSTMRPCPSAFPGLLSVNVQDGLGICPVTLPETFSLRARGEEGPVNMVTAYCAARLAAAFLEGEGSSGPGSAPADGSGTPGRTAVILAPSPSQARLCRAMLEDSGKAGLKALAGEPADFEGFPPASLVILDTALGRPAGRHPWAGGPGGVKAVLEALALAGGALVLLGPERRLAELPAGGPLGLLYRASADKVHADFRTPVSDGPFRDALDGAASTVFCALPGMGPEWWESAAPSFRGALRRGVSLTVFAAPPKDAPADAAGSRAGASGGSAKLQAGQSPADLPERADERSRDRPEEHLRALRVSGAQILLAEGFPGFAATVDRRRFFWGEPGGGPARAWKTVCSLDAPRAAAVLEDVLQLPLVGEKLGPGSYRSCPMCGWPFLIVNRGRRRGFGDANPLKLGCTNPSCPRSGDPRPLDERWPFQAPPLCREDGRTPCERVLVGRKEFWVCPNHPDGDTCPRCRTVPGDPPGKRAE